MPDLWACRQHQACCAALWEERQRSSLVSATSHGEKHKWHCCHIKVLVCLEVFRPQWTGHTWDPISLFLSILVYTLPFQVCLVFIHFKYLCTEIAPWIVLRLAVKHNLSIHLFHAGSVQFSSHLSLLFKISSFAEEGLSKDVASAHC